MHNLVSELFWLLLTSIFFFHYSRRFPSEDHFKSKAKSSSSQWIQCRTLPVVLYHRWPKYHRQIHRPNRLRHLARLRHRILPNVKVDDFFFSFYSTILVSNEYPRQAKNQNNYPRGKVNYCYKLIACVHTYQLTVRSLPRPFSCTHLPSSPFVFLGF